MKKIFICGEDATIKANTKLLLKSKGFLVESRNHCRDLFEMVPKFRPDLILVELSVSQIDGKITHELRSDKRTAHIPLIVLGVPNEKNDIPESGNILFIQKPFNTEELIGLINDNITG